MTALIKTFFDPDTFSFSHLVTDPVTGSAAIIDPVLNYDPAAVSTSTKSAQIILDEIATNKLTLKWILETHVHADHMSAAFWLKQQTGAPIVISKGVCQVQTTFNDIYGFTQENAAIPQDFDKLIADGEELALGELTVKAMHTQGHTPSCCTYLIANNAFVGDTLFMPDFGTARCDFPGGDASQLYQSIQKILALPEETQLFMCHDYKPGGRELQWQTSVKAQKENNIHIHQGVSESDYVKMRTERDAQLSVPKLILPSLQVNIRAGRLPEADKNAKQFLKLPLNVFKV